MAGKTVNIKAYGRHESILDIGQHHCDYYLVLTGPTGQATEPEVTDPVVAAAACWLSLFSPAPGP